jgi:soluble lytic murein transglycosylase-like protein
MRSLLALFVAAVCSLILAAPASAAVPIAPAPFATPHTIAGHSPIVRRMVMASSRRYRVPPGVVAGIAKVETNFHSQAVSRSGAQGVMMLMPQTAAALGVTDPFDAWQGLAGGSKLLGMYLETYDGNVRLAIAAYRIGPASVHPGHLDADTRVYIARVLAAGRRLGYSTSTVSLPVR